MPCRTRPDPGTPWLRAGRAALLSGLLALLSACALLPAPAGPGESARDSGAPTPSPAGAPAAPAVPAAAAPAAAAAASAPAGAASAAAEALPSASGGGPAAAASAPIAPPRPLDAADLAVRRVLAAHESLRRLSPVELAAEITRLQAQLPGAGQAQYPALALELALALAQSRQAGELARALALLEPIARTPSPAQQPWQPIARLLQARIYEQRRQEELLERLAAQLRDSQRQVQQLQDKLEALKAIERSLLQRSPGLPPPAPGAVRP
ncbi:MAG: hypothetical protein L6Q75_07245 [Burkholderiaceae bacterium]|nr:hypothetical protein [Burkholderiaceae bacterium]